MARGGWPLLSASALPLALLASAHAARFAPAEVSHFDAVPDARMDTLADVFRTLDENQDGRIDRQELLRAALLEADSSFVTLVEKLFAWADAGGDGYLDRAEAEHFMIFLDKHVSEGTLAGTASTADVDSREFGDSGDEIGDDDYLATDADEQDRMANFATHEEQEEAGEDAGMVAQLFAELDDNDDGYINKRAVLDAADYDEDPTFVHLVDELFDMADANGDGRLNRSEAAELVKLLREHVEEAAFFGDLNGADDADSTVYSDDEVDEAVFIASAGHGELD